MYAGEGGSLLGRTAAPAMPSAEPQWAETICGLGASARAEALHATGASPPCFEMRDETADATGATGATGVTGELAAPGASTRQEGRLMGRACATAELSAAWAAGTEGAYTLRLSYGSTLVSVPCRTRES